MKVTKGEFRDVINPFNTIRSFALPWPNFTPPRHTLEAHNSAGNGFTSLKLSPFNRKLNFEKKTQLFFFAGFTPDPP